MWTKQSKNTGPALVAAGLLMAIGAAAWKRRGPSWFTGESVVVTGGSRGLGLVLARQLAAEGARLMLIARDRERASRAADSIRERHPSAELSIVPADVRDRSDVDRAIAATSRQRYGAP